MAMSGCFARSRTAQAPAALSAGGRRGAGAPHSLTRSVCELLLLLPQLAPPPLRPERPASDPIRGTLLPVPLSCQSAVPSLSRMRFLRSFVKSFLSALFSFPRIPPPHLLSCTIPAASPNHFPPVRLGGKESFGVSLAERGRCAHSSIRGPTFMPLHAPHQVYVID